MKHCCSSCFCECDGKISQVLKSGRKIYFCCDKCKKNWEINKENYLTSIGEKNNVQQEAMSR